MVEMTSTIVDAAARILREEGADALTTRRVAAAAGTQAPTIYRLFGDKDGLLRAVADQVMAAYVATKAEGSLREGEDDGDPIADLRSGFRRHVEFGLANPELFALLSAPGRRLSASDVEGRDVLRARVHRVAAAGLLRVGEERAVQMLSAAGNGAILIMLGTPVADRDPSLGEAMFGAVLGTITTQTPVEARPPVAPAVALSATLPELPGLTEAERLLMGEWLTRSIALLQE